MALKFGQPVTVTVTVTVTRQQQVARQQAYDPLSPSHLPPVGKGGSSGPFLDSGSGLQTLDSACSAALLPAPEASRLPPAASPPAASAASASLPARPTKSSSCSSGAAVDMGRRRATSHAMAATENGNSRTPFQAGPSAHLQQMPSVPELASAGLGTAGARPEGPEGGSWEAHGPEEAAREGLRRVDTITHNKLTHPHTRNDLSEDYWCPDAI